MKLATELSKRDTGRTLYILDEPTTGLHFEDIRILMDVLRQIVDRGNTVIIIEHNLDVIKTADHIIDLGPEGGDGGGAIVAEGTPEEVFSQVQMLKKHRLDVPQATELAYKLKCSGVKIDKMPLTDEECVEMLEEVLM